MEIKAELRNESVNRRLEVTGLRWGIREIENVEARWERDWTGWVLARVDLEVADPVDRRMWLVVRRFTESDIKTGVLPGGIRELVEQFQPKLLGIDDLLRTAVVAVDR
jgi:hypothetical protein